MQIELDEDQVIGAFLEELIIALDTFENMYESRANGDKMAYFDDELPKDLKILKKHIKACKLLLKYYGKGEE